MKNSASDDRRYSDEEFALILRKASELQERGPRPPSSRGGMSLAEIQAIAAEAGIDAQLVAQTASLLPTRGSDRAARVLGGPSSYHLEHSTAGEISQEDLGRFLDVIRRVTKHQGQGTRVLDSLEWRTVGEVSQIHINVTARDGQTRVQIIGDRQAAGALTYVSSGLAWMIAAVAIGSGLDVTSAVGVLSILAGAAGGAFLTARTIWKSTSSGFRRKVTELMEELSSAVEHAVESRSETAD